MMQFGSSQLKMISPMMLVVVTVVVADLVVPDLPRDRDVDDLVDLVVMQVSLG